MWRLGAEARREQLRFGLLVGPACRVSLVRDLEILNGLRPRRNDGCNPVDKCGAVVRRRRQVGVLPDRQLHAQTEGPVRQIQQAGEVLVPGVAARVDYAIGPTRPDHAEDANVIDAVLREIIQMPLESLLIVLVSPERPEQRRANRKVLAVAVRKGAAVEPNETFSNRPRRHGARYHALLLL